MLAAPPPFSFAVNDVSFGKLVSFALVPSCSSSIWPTVYATGGREVATFEAKVIPAT